jgi:hypothetical protein
MDMDPQHPPHAQAQSPLEMITQALQALQEQVMHI